ncbi:DNA-binding transcriptional response regulator, NtrC family, contains REC, AAA-type ATPase, and a Fis-type DNA-binding domains [Alteromonadaceae bacterium Bs31]|nr:DNA-binding transcriptional response regulator, NtrC family, contains REC, AAA-type ATPase, and a Fis-type DNA-binding domains [Alteromonadaceae bacterium Bs31]
MIRNILIADDDSDILAALSILLKSEGFEPFAVGAPAEVLDAIRLREFDLCIIDLNYTRDTTSGEEGLALISDIRKLDEWLPIVVMTGWASIDVAVATIKNGANDFVQKPWENDRLLSIIRTQLDLASEQKKSQKLQQHNQLLREEAEGEAEFVFESDAMKRVLAMAKQVAQSDASVLLTGENGTGKSIFAQYIHNQSPRSASPFISVNMGSVTETLFESEMFGHVKGAFTDAKSARIGRFELADSGTLFLDEIANAPLSQQGKLLRVLESHQFERVGSSKTQTADVRMICATNANLKNCVSNNEFREDLLYRLNTVEIEIPPLRARKADIVLLAKFFLSKIAHKYAQPVLSLQSCAVEMLLSYSWPGNVRELNHVMERAHILCGDSAIHASDLGLDCPQVSGPNSENSSIEDAGEMLSLSQIELNALRSRLAHFNGDAVLAAESLGLSRSAFYRRIGKEKQK